MEREKIEKLQNTMGKRQKQGKIKKNENKGIRKRKKNNQRKEQKEFIVFFSFETVKNKLDFFTSF